MTDELRNGHEPPPYPPPFEDFGKMPRYNTLQCVVTEKIDGTNAQIYVPHDPKLPVIAGSRTRWITPEKDNFDFARFVEANADELRRLGPGRHYGEYWGQKIGRTYGLDHRRLTLFSVDRYTDLPSCCDVVPVLYRGQLDATRIANTVELLFRDGSVAAPGWATPEGVVVSCAGQRWKVTDHGDKAKGKALHLKAIEDGLTYESVQNANGEHIVNVFGFDAAGQTWGLCYEVAHNIASGGKDEQYTRHAVAESIYNADAARKASAL